MMPGSRLCVWRNGNVGLAVKPEVEMEADGGQAMAADPKAVVRRFDDDLWHNPNPAVAEAILAEINRLSGGEPILVTLSGGNPALQPLEPLVLLGQLQGHRFAMETQGSKAQPWFDALDYLTLSPKPPSSGMPFRQDRFDACLAAAGAETQVSLKLVIADEADYQWARTLAANYPQLPLFLQPCNPTPATPEQPAREADTQALNAQLRWLVERIAADRWYRPRVLPQLHVLIWNNERGV